MKLHFLPRFVNLRAISQSHTGCSSTALNALSAEKFLFSCGALSDIECAKTYAKMAESAKTLANQQVSEQRTLWNLYSEPLGHRPETISIFVSGVHALPRDIRGSVQERHWVQPAGTADRSRPPKQQVHAGAKDARLREKQTNNENKWLVRVFICLRVFFFLFFSASSYQKEWTRQTKKRGEGAVATGTKEDGGLIDVKVAFLQRPHTHTCLQNWVVLMTCGLFYLQEGCGTSITAVCCPRIIKWQWHRGVLQWQPY